MTFKPAGVITERQRRHPDRQRPVLHDHRREVRLLRGRQPAAGDRAAHGHDAAQRHRRADARGGADEPRRDQLRSCAPCSTRRPAAGGSASTASRSRRSTRPQSIQEAMEKQMRAERDRRAAILTAEGSKQSQILNAEGEKQAAVLTRRGRSKTAAILRAEGEAKAIDTVFQAIHDGDPDQGLLSYQYLQMLPKLAQGDANKIFVIPSEFSQALGTAAGAIAGAVRADAAAGAAAAVSAYIVDDAVEDYAAAHTTPPARAPAGARQRDARDAQLAADAHRGRRGPLPRVPRVPRAAAARARDRHVLGLQRAVDGRRAAAGRPDRHAASCSTSTPTSPSATSPPPGCADRIEVRRGPALETIATLDGPFDLVFIDADKAGYLAYYEAVLPKLVRARADRRRQRAVERARRASRRPTTTAESTIALRDVQRPRRRRRARRERHADRARRDHARAPRLSGRRPCLDRRADARTCAAGEERCWSPPARGPCVHIGRRGTTMDENSPAAQSPAGLRVARSWSCSMRRSWPSRSASTTGWTRSGLAHAARAAA